MDLASLQTTLFHFPSFPALWVPHCIIMALNLRATFGANWRNFARQHPLSCYLLAILYTYPGGIISSLLLAEQPFTFLTNTNSVLAMTLSWYLVFYTPGDLFVTLIDTFKLHTPFAAMQDFLRMHLVLSGVQTIHKLHPNAILYPIVFATAKSSGFVFLKYFEYILQFGVDKAFVIPHHSTKTCFLASIIFTLRATIFVNTPLEPLFACVVLYAVTLRLITNSAFPTHDPYVLFEGLLSAIAFGRPESVANLEKNGGTPKATAVKKQKNKVKKED